MDSEISQNNDEFVQVMLVQPLHQVIWIEEGLIQSLTPPITTSHEYMIYPLLSRSLYNGMVSMFSMNMI